MKEQRSAFGAALVGAVCLAVTAALLRWRPADSSALLVEVGVAAAIVAAALLVGSAGLARTRLGRGLDALELAVHGVAVGLGLLVLGVLALGLAARLSRASAVVLLVAAAGAGLAGLRGSASTLAEAGRSLVAEIRSSPWLALVLGLGLAMPLAVAVLPEVFYDSLLYHLEAPARWLAAGRLAAAPHAFHLDYPVNASALYLLALAIAPTVSAGVVHWAFLAASAVALIAIGRPLGARVGLVAATLFVVTPSALEVAHFAMADLAVVFWCLAAVLAWLRWTDSGRPSLLALAGFELGLAVGAKYTAILVGLVPVALATLLARSAGDTRRRVSALVLLGLGAVLAFSPWLLRNGLETGNPVYPYLFKARPAFAVEHSLGQEIENRMPDGTGLGAVLAHLARGPLELVTTGLGMAPLVGFALFAPLALLLLRGPLPAPVRRLLAIVGVAFLCWDATVHLTRYALPFLAVLAIPAAVALLDEPVAWRRRTIAICVGLGLAQNLFLGWLTSDWNALRDLLRGRTTREAYVADKVSYYGAVRWANEHLGQGDTILFFGEARGYYCRIPHLTTGPESRQLLFEIAERRGERTLAEALAERGVGYILSTRGEVQRLVVNGRPRPPSPAVEAAVAELFAHSLEILYDDGEAWLARVG